MCQTIYINPIDENKQKKENDHYAVTDRREGKK